MDFSKEQQATIDAMINKRVGEIKAKHEKELADTGLDLKKLLL